MHDSLSKQLNRLEKVLGLVAQNVTTLLEQGATMSAELDALKAAVTANNTLIDRAIAQIQDLAAKLATTDNPAELQALATSLQAKATELQAVLPAPPTP